MNAFRYVLDYSNFEMKGTIPRKKVVLLIIDGFGIAPHSEGNAISLANTSNWNSLKQKYEMVELKASGSSVGLPDGVMGNSEVGHLTIGTGRTTFQALELINRSCIDGTLEKNPVISDIISFLHNSKGSLHLMGLVSDGGVHSHQLHLNTLLDIFSQHNLNQIWIHAFTDGRDTPPNSSVKYIQSLLDKISQHQNCDLASIIGRYYVMDRDKKWDRIKIAYDMLVHMKGSDTINDPIVEIRNRYEKSETDEFLKPIIIRPEGKIQSGDAVLFFNFRSDRARQITAALNGHGKLKDPGLKKLYYATMTRYETKWAYPVLMESPKISSSLAELISKNGLFQAHIAETEKYAHVTYFLNGGEEEPFENELRILIPSLKIATYDLQPEMKTLQIGESIVEIIQKRQHHLVVVNIAGPDMVGHTGNIPATIKAVEVTDQVIGKINTSCKENGYFFIITSDHGNSEQMLYEGNPHTAHTTNVVPFLITNNIKLIKKGGLKNVAPTVLELLGIDKPIEMNGTSLIQ